MAGVTTTNPEDQVTVIEGHEGVIKLDALIIQKETQTREVILLHTAFLTIFRAQPNATLASCPLSLSESTNCPLSGNDNVPGSVRRQDFT